MLSRLAHTPTRPRRASGRPRPSVRPRNEAASSEPSIYSVRTVERIIGHSLHGQSKAEEAESERARRRPACLPSWAQARHVSSGVHFGRKEVILYSLRSVQRSPPATSSRAHSLLFHARAHLSTSCRGICALLYSSQSVLVIYSPCEVAVLLHHRSVPPSTIIARGRTRTALFIRAVILQSLCRTHM